MQLLVAQMSVLVIFLFFGLYQCFHKLKLTQEEANIRSEIAEKLITIEKQHAHLSKNKTQRSMERSRGDHVVCQINLKIC